MLLPGSPLPAGHYDKEMPNTEVQHCPVEEAIKIIGGKWKLLVLRSLLLNGPQRYNELLRSVTSISQKELTRNLRELTAAGLVAQDPGASRLTPYQLTKPGKGLMPVFKKLLTWGQKRMNTLQP